METIVDYHVIHLRNSANSKSKHENILENEKILGQPINIYDAKNAKDLFVGKKFVIPEFDKDFKFKFRYSHIGEVGCYLSHLLLIKSFFDSSIPQSKSKYSVIFEDDFEICHDNLHEEILDILLNKLNDKEFDILYLGNLDDNRDEQVIDNIYTINMRIGFCGCHGYLVNLQNAEKIYKSLLHFDAAIDNKLKEIFKKNLLIIENISIVKTQRIPK